MADKGVKQQAAPWQQQWKHAVAGCTAGLASVLALHPLDVIKTRLQVQDGAGVLPVYRGTLDAVRHIISEEGWRALYSGLTPALIGSGMAWGIYFFSYNRAKERYQRAAARRQQAAAAAAGSLSATPAASGSGRGARGARQRQQQAAAQQAQQELEQAQQAQRLSPMLHLISAAEAGALVCLLTNPVWVIKTRLQLQRGGALAAAASGAGASSNGMYKGFTDALVQITRTEGIRGLYKGLLPSLLLVSHGAIQLAVYEELKSLAQHFPGFDRAWAYITSNGASGSGSSSSAGPRRERVLSSAEITACGALSKLAASIATYPSQVVRARLQQRMDSGRSLLYTGVGDVLRKTMAREGLAGFYKGLVPNVLRVMPQSALTFLVYESVMYYLAEKKSVEVL